MNNTKLKHQRILVIKLINNLKQINKTIAMSFFDCINLIAEKCISSFQSLKQDINANVHTPSLISTKSQTLKRQHPGNKIRISPSTKPKIISGYSPERQRSLELQIKAAQRRKKELLDELKTVDNSLNDLMRDKRQSEELISRMNKQTIQHLPSYQQKTAKALQLVKKMNRQRRQMGKRKLYAEQKVLKEIERSFEHVRQIQKAEQIRKQQKRKLINDKIEQRRSVHLKSIKVVPKRSLGFATQGASPTHTDTTRNIETRRYQKLTKLITENGHLRMITEGSKQPRVDYNFQYQKMKTSKTKESVYNPERQYYSSFKYRS